MAGPPTPRTTAALVTGLKPDVDATVDLTPFIAIANQLTTDACEPFITGMDTQGNKVTIDTSYTDGFVGSKMELIERNLAAHFYTVWDQALASARAGSVGAGFQFKVGLMLNLTVYGSNAMLLDTGGALAKLNNADQTKRKVRIGGFWNGRHLRRDIDFGGLWADLTVVQ